MPVTIPRLIVELFQHVNYGGRSTVVLEPVRFTNEIGFQEGVSSIKVYKGPAFKSSPNYKAIMHEDRDFRGRKLALGPGFYPNIHDLAYNFRDRISSISFGSDLQGTGPEWGTMPVIIEVYPDPNFMGDKVTILRDVPFTETIGMQDNIQSFRILKGPNFPAKGCKVIFYEHIDFQGAAIPIELKPRDAMVEIPNLGLLPERWNGKISSVRVEGWSSSTVFSHLVFHDEFEEATLKDRWRWQDPRGFGQWGARQGYLQMNVASGVDLWHGLNFDAPRLIQRISGDFTIETRMPVTPQLREHGGLLVWRDENHFVRLEKTSGAHAFQGDVRFERHRWRAYDLVGRAPALTKSKHLFLRLEKTGDTFRGFASEDGVNWISCGEVTSSMLEPIWVGMHALAPGNIPPTETRFDYFRIFRRVGEAGDYQWQDTRRMGGRSQFYALTGMRNIVR